MSSKTNMHDELAQMLDSSDGGLIHLSDRDQEKAAIQHVANLHRQAAQGENIDRSTWHDAQTTASNAALAASKPAVAFTLLAAAESAGWSTVRGEGWQSLAYILRLVRRAHRQAPCIPPLPDETLITKRLCFSVKDEGVYRELGGGRAYRPERMEVNFRRDGTGPWILDFVVVGGPNILKNGKVGKTTVNCVLFTPSYTRDEVHEGREVEQEIYNIPDIVYEVLEKYWPTRDETMRNIDQLLQSESDAIEANPDAPLTTDTKVTRGHMSTTPYERRLKLATNAVIEAHMVEGWSPESVAAYVLHAIDTIPEKLR